MINKLDILKYAKRFLRERRVSYDRRLIHPTRDWLIALSCFFAIILAGGAYNAAQFVSYRTIDVNEQPVTDTPITYNQALVDQVLRDYQERRMQYDALQGARFSIESDSEIQPASSEPIEATDSEDGGLRLE